MLFNSQQVVIENYWENAAMTEWVLSTSSVTIMMSSS